MEKALLHIGENDSRKEFLEKAAVSIDRLGEKFTLHKIYYRKLILALYIGI